jgi:hypothetical protein
VPQPSITVFSRQTACRVAAISLSWRVGHPFDGFPLDGGSPLDIPLQYVNTELWAPLFRVADPSRFSKGLDFGVPSIPG